MLTMPTPEQIEKIKIASQLLGYHAYPLKVFPEDKEFLPYPVFTTAPIDENKWKNDRARYEAFELLKIMVSGEWNPLINLKHSKQLEEKLLKEGRYNFKFVNWSLSKLGSMGAEKIGADTIKILYGDSISFRDISGEGKTEQEAIINAAAIFFQNREEYRRSGIESAQLLGY